MSKIETGFVAVRFVSEHETVGFVIESETSGVVELEVRDLVDFLESKRETLSLASPHVIAACFAATMYDAKIKVLDDLSQERVNAFCASSVDSRLVEVD